MTDKIRNLLEDVQTVYEGKGMVVHPNSFDKLRMEVIKLDNINKQQSEQLTKAKEIIREYSKCECEYCDYKRNPDYVTMHCSQCQKYSLHKEAEQFLSKVKK